MYGEATLKALVVNVTVTGLAFKLLTVTPAGGLARLMDASVALLSVKVTVPLSGNGLPTGDELFGATVKVAVKVTAWPNSERPVAGVDVDGVEDTSFMVVTAGVTVMVVVLLNGAKAASPE
jgi:hypothetical protein